MHQRPDFSIMLDALGRAKEPGRVPFFELFADGEIIEEVMGFKLADPAGESGKYFDQLVSFYYELGYDYVPFYLTPRFPLAYQIESEDTALYRRSRRKWVNEKDGPIRSLKDLKEAHWPEPEEALDFELFRELGKHLPPGMKIIGGAAGGPFEHASMLLGLERFSLAIYEEPELVDELVGRIGRVLVGAARIISSFDRVGAYCFGDDLGYKTATIFSPKHLRRLVFPWYSEIARIVHTAGKPFILHSCGNLTAVMDDIIATGIDAKHSFEDIITPVSLAKKLWGWRIAVLGGVDVDFLCKADPESVRKHTLKLLEECAPGGGYALGTGNTVANYIPVKNYLAMLAAGNEFNGR